MGQAPRLNEPAEVETVFDSVPPLGQDIFVVSGLPRSGTSLLMQMLHAGGMKILTDRVRTADEDNPKGYFEFEAVKKLPRELDWIEQARGKALKVIVPLVCSLPEDRRYRVVIIERDYDEILASQAKMIERRGESIEDSPQRRQRLRKEYERLMGETKTILSRRAGVRLALLHHQSVIADPAAAAALLNRVAGGALDEAAMSATVDRSLHRNRSSEPR